MRLNKLPLADFGINKNRTIANFLFFIYSNDYQLLGFLLSSILKDQPFINRYNGSNQRTYRKFIFRYLTQIVKIDLL